MLHVLTGTDTQGTDGISKIKDGYNPATWMLEITSTAQEAVVGVNFSELYKNSGLYRRNKALIKELSVPAPGSRDIHFLNLFWYLIFMYFTLLYFTFYGMMVVAVTPNHNIAAIISSSFFALWYLFSGFIIPKSRIPVWWRWYYYICPISWTLYGLVASQFGDIKAELETKETVEEFVRKYFEFRHDYVGYVAIVIIGISVLFGFIFAFSIRTFNFQKR
ncbi:hypothetical protein ACS0TY_033755 [Phlomoides rotata]